MTLAKVGLFAAVMLIAGRRVLPWLLEQVARTGSRELFTLAVLAAALGIALVSASLFGVSLALGAFFAGMVLSESDLSYEAAAKSLPLQDAFAVLFFVSVGMLFDPMVLVRDPLPALATLAIVIIGKSVAALVLVVVLGHSMRTGLTISASLAQVGEFSFILTGLGVALGILPSAGRDLILAAAILSITLNPAVFAAVDRLADRITRSKLSRPRWWPHAGETAPAVPHGEASHLRGHAVVVGHGRVGALVCRMLADRGQPFVVVEQDRRRAEDLRARGMTVVWGDGGEPEVLAAAGVPKARLVVLAAPGTVQARRVVMGAKALNTLVDIVVRANGEDDMGWLDKNGVGMAAMGERELSLAMGAYALVRLGVPEAEARVLVQRFRGTLRVGEGLTVDGSPAPELRPRREDEPAAEVL